MESKIILTGDGSHTIESQKYGVTYHSIHGAIEETNHVFLKNGLYEFSHKYEPIHILEIGWGTGLNSYCTYLENLKLNKNIHYTAIEAYPISVDDAQLLNYHQLLHQVNNKEFLLFHECDWNTFIDINHHFSFRKILKHFEDIDFNNEFDIIYYDAFAPTAQAELWEIPVLQLMYNALKENGILVTYCAKGSFKRTLKSLGFEVERLPGPPRKREMTRAKKVL